MNKTGGRFGRFYGSTTLSERGQVVIPAEARETMGLEAGTKLMIFGAWGGNGLLLMRGEAVREFLTRASERFAEFEATLQEIAREIEKK